MTTVGTAAGRDARRAIGLLTMVGILATALAGCETGGSLLGALSGGSSSEQPATAEVTTPAPSTTQSAQTKVAIMPVIGPPEAAGKQLVGQLSSAAALQRINVSTTPNEKVDYSLRGYIMAAKDKSSTKLTYMWDITDPTGKRMTRLTGEEVVTAGSGKDPWSSLTPAASQLIADKTAAQLDAWLISMKNPQVAANAASGSAASVQQASLGAAGPTTGSIGKDAVSTMVANVSGAPGDGSVALTSALQRELSRSGVSLAGSSTGAYRVEGKVALGPAKDGKQPIQIDWHVKDPGGKKLGTVSQKNEIPQGSLDGAWGKTADAAAAAAAQGILKLLPQQGQKSIN